MDERRNYEPQPIPSREELKAINSETKEQTPMSEEKSPWEIKFAEILLEDRGMSGVRKYRLLQIKNERCFMKCGKLPAGICPT